jgi:hypothetical protein
MISFTHFIFLTVHHCEMLLCLHILVNTFHSTVLLMPFSFGCINIFPALSYFSLLQVRAVNLFWINYKACSFAPL